MKTSLMFTVLPRGRQGNQVRLSLFVTPKVKDAGLNAKLSSTQLVDLPGILRKAKYSVYFGRIEDKAAGLLDPQGAEANARFDSTLWKRFFTGTTPVQNFPSVKYERASLASFSTSEVHTDITALYRDASGSLVPPSVGQSGSPELTKRVSEVASVVKTTPEAGARLIPTTGIISSRNKIAPSGGARDEYLRAAVFYNRDNWREKKGIARPKDPPNKDKSSLEFHEIIGALGDHPALLRRLGLVIDLVAEVPANAKPAESVWVSLDLSPTVLGSGGEFICPTTLYTLTADSFTSALYAPGKSEDANLPITQDGMLPLSGSAYLVSHLDVDHAATEFIEYAVDTQTKVAAGGTAQAKLPALRTAGIGIYRDNREADYTLRLNRPETYEKTPGALTFTADELVRGYRFDVSEQASNGAFGPWQSLCQRVTTAALGDGTALTITDEGVVKASAVSSTNASNDMLNVHESLARWNGYSLVASRPGRPAPDSNSEAPEFIQNSGSALGMPVALKIRAKPGSLPRLRLGRTYCFRGRVTDLAGNDFAHAPASAPAIDTDTHSEAITLRRYEPVSPPTLVLQNALTEGESLEHVVIRSNPYGKVPQDPKAYADAANLLPKKVGALNGPMNTYGATCERHMAPSKTSFQLAEMHGAMDAYFDAAVSPEQQVYRSFAVAIKEEGSFYDASVMDTSVFPPVDKTSGCMLVTPSGAVGAAPGDIGIKPMPARIDRSESLLPGQYVVYPQKSVRLPYLPDPNASGIAIHDLAAGHFTQKFSGSWPEVKPMRLVLEQGSKLAVTGLKGAEDLVKVALPAGTRTALRYSATVTDASVMEHGSDAQSTDIQNGKHSLLSPAREIVFVHAVQQPMKPTLRSADLTINDRNAGDTTITLNAPIGVDGPSTNHVDLVATWQEIVDGQLDPSKNPLENPTNFKSNVHSRNVSYADFTAQVPVGTVQSFGDTKRRDVTYKTVASTRYREYFAPSVTFDPANVTNESAGVARIIRSTARPPIPKVLYCVPNFRWKETLGTSTVTQRSGGIRVYVDRGWFASGADERLAVVLTNKGAAVSNHAAVSVWGNDPTWFAQSDLAPLNESAFAIDATDRDGFTVVNDVPTAEDATTKVTVVTFKPKFHPERKVWYFDIPIDPKLSYFPFARLAFARYQPYSVGSLHLSRVVQGEFTQISATRTTTITPGVNNFAISVDGIGGTNVKLDDKALGISGGTNEWQRGASGHLVKVEFQESTRSRADELDYRVLGTALTLTPYAGSGASASNPVVSFRGTLTVPGSASPSAKHRIVIREYERYQTDAEEGVAKGSAEVNLGKGATSYTERVVYADSITVDI